MMKRLGCVLAAVIGLYAGPVGAQPSQGGPREFTAAVIQEQNVTFAVMVVKAAILNDKKLADELIVTMEPSFGGIPVILMVQDSQGTPSYYGRPDIAQFMSSVPVDKISWKKYTLTESRS